MIFSAESRYNQWVREHYRFLLRSAWALTGSRATAEDVVQDCFTSAWRFRYQLRDQSMARAWLFQIMRRHAFRHFDPAQLQALPLQDSAEEGVNHHDALDAQLDVVKALAHLPKGTHTLASRATDVKGNVQPETRGENQSGYNNTSWADHAVTVTVA